MKTYLFLIAWVEGSPSAEGAKTGIHKQEDLMPQYLAGNEHHISALEITVPDIASAGGIAHALGYKYAFFDMFNAQDSVSTCKEIDRNTFKHPYACQKVVIA